MRVLILGGTGMIGHRLAASLLQMGYDVAISARHSISILEELVSPHKFSFVFKNIDGYNPTGIQAAINKFKPEIIINAIGIVKQLEKSKIKKELIQLNSLFPQHLAELCAQNNVRLIHMSTDCVFDGEEGNYNELDKANAQDLYGITKSLGETDNYLQSLTIRTSTVGREIKPHGGLLEWFLNQKGKTVNGFSNAIYSGFPIHTLAKVFSEYVFENNHLKGLIHISTEPIDKFSLLHMFKEIFKVQVEIINEPNVKIYRSLDCSKFSDLTGYTPLKWQEIVEDLLVDNEFYNELRRNI